MELERKESGPPAVHLGLWDAASIMVGIIIGVGIFETPGRVFQIVPGPWTGLGVWAIGGLLALVGALCFAELASAYPRSGGEYVYLTRAFGSWVGFLFSWAQLTVIRPAGIGILAYIFAHYAGLLWDLKSPTQLALALTAILVLTGINFLGVVLGKKTQNFLTLTKVLGLGVIVAAGFSLANFQPGLPTDPMTSEAGWFATAMIFVLWTYAGWHEAAYVASEIHDSPKNLPLSLIFATLAVTVIYLLINGALLFALGFEGAKSKTVASDLVAQIWEGYGEQVFCLLVMVSALSALNGMIFTTARIYMEFGADHRVFSSLSRWSRRWHTPARALAVQGILSTLWVMGVSMSSVAGKERDTFDNLVNATAAVFWLFFFLTGLALFVLRKKEPHQPRPFRVPAYPWLPLIFCLWCGYMVFGAVRFRPQESLISLVLLLVGVPLYFIPKKIKARRFSREGNPPLPETSQKGSPVAGG